MILSVELERALSKERLPACGTDTRGDLVFLNAAWDECAAPDAPRVQRAWLLGRSWFEAISADARPFFEHLFHSALALAHDARGALLHLSECNTPTLVRRSLTWLAPVFEHQRAVGVVMVYGLEDRGPAHELYGLSPEPVDAFHDARGGLQQCGDCGRLLHPVTGAWAFVPDALSRRDPRARLATCPTCAATYGVAPRVVASRWPA